MRMEMKAEIRMEVEMGMGIGMGMGMEEENGMEAEEDVDYEESSYIAQLSIELHSTVYELLGGSGSVVIIKEDFEGVFVGVAIKLANDDALKSEQMIENNNQLQTMEV